MPPFSEIEKRLPRQLCLLHCDWLDDNVRSTEKYITLTSRLRTNLSLYRHRYFHKIGSADAAPVSLRNHFDKTCSLRFPEEDCRQRGSVENHFGRPCSSYKNSAWSRYGCFTCAAARPAMARSSSAPARPLRDERWLYRSRRASVTTRVMLSPVSRAIAAANRCASGSLTFRVFITKVDSAKSELFLPFYPQGRARPRAVRQHPERRQENAQLLKQSRFGHLRRLYCS